MTKVPRGFNAKRTILLVDDDDYFRFALATELRAAGYVVICAEDGERGIRMVRESTDGIITFHIVITDLVMPRKNGLKFCQELRSIDRNVPVLVITGNLSPELEWELGELGCADYLEKPFTPDELIGKVEIMIPRKGGDTNDESS